MRGAGILSAAVFVAALVPPPTGVVAGPVFLSADDADDGGGEGPLTASGPSGPGFCGTCTLASAIGCASDADCAPGSFGTCDFSQTDPGFHGNAGLSTIALSGKRGPFEPILAGVACAGRTGDPGVDAMLGLPGPLTWVQPVFDAFQYP